MKLKAMAKRALHPPAIARALPPLSRPPASSTEHAPESAVSLLLHARNPVLHPHLYVARKAPPRPHTFPSQTPLHPPPSQNHLADLNLHESMDASALRAGEGSWAADPYIRMLGTPLRKCMITKQRLPSDFLIRLTVMQSRAPLKPAPSSAADSAVPPPAFLFPDGIEHPRFRAKGNGRGCYVLCWKDALEELGRNRHYKRINPEAPFQFHSLLVSQVGHQLRLRVIQELELLCDRLQCLPQSAFTHPVLRRLSRREWSQFQETGTMKDLPKIIALIVVPRVNRSSGQEYGLPPTCTTPSATVVPVSTIHCVPPVPDPVNPANVVPLQLPVYNGVSLFPSAGDRSNFREGLSRMLRIERKARRHDRKSALNSFSDTDGGGQNDKASYTYALYSDEHTSKMVDVVPLAIALWRVRLWEGGAWSDSGSEGSSSEQSFGSLPTDNPADPQ